MINVKFCFSTILILMAIMFMYSCDSGDSAGTDGTDGVNFGGTCTGQDDCKSGVCVPGTTGNFCTVACRNSAECNATMAGSCCDAKQNYCLLPEQCGSALDGDGVTNLCNPGDYRCASVGDNVEECQSNGDWKFYRSCPDVGKVCAEGDCVDGNSDGDTEATEAETEEPCDTANLRKCVGNAVWKCMANGDGELVWQEYLACSTGDQCKEGKCEMILGEACEKDAECGNGEYCLPSESDPTKGNCVKACDSDDVHCPRGWQCAHGRCEQIKGFCRSSIDCIAGKQFCDKLPGKEDGMCRTYCIEDGVSCEALTKCDEQTKVDDGNGNMIENPNYGRCVLVDPSCNPCDYDGDCGNGYYCETVTGQTRGCCREKCSASKPCIEPLTCNSSGHCVIGEGKGDCGGPCPTGHVCDKVFNECVLNCPQCPANKCCDAQSAPNCYVCKCENPAICGILLPPCCFGFSCSAVVYGVLGWCQ